VWLCRFLTEEGLHPAILSRGYGRKRKNAARVTLGQDHRLQCEAFGDEPAVMASALPSVPVWVGRDRVFSGRKALVLDERVDALVLDDGFQHLALSRDLDLVLLDCRRPFANGFTLPLGPLREPVSHLARADALILTRAAVPSEVHHSKSLIEKQHPGK